MRCLGGGKSRGGLKGEALVGWFILAVSSKSYGLVEITS